jgi:hypothetical protein
MKAIISTAIPTSAEKMWAELQDISSLVYVAAPLLRFKAQGKKPLPEKWCAGREYPLRISLFGVIPLGNHAIRISEIDDRNMQIRSNESGLLAREWNHLIKVERTGIRTIRYTDEIEIKAGTRTFGIWLFAIMFYRHRQKRWKKLLMDDRVAGRFLQNNG